MNLDDFMGRLEESMAGHRLAWALSSFAAGSVVVFVIWLMSGGYGECANDKDCGAGQYCMEWPLNAPGLTKPWWARLKTYQTCETLCGEGRKPCPPNQSCVHSAHGEPPICLPR